MTSGGQTPPAGLGSRLRALLIDTAPIRRHPQFRRLVIGQSVSSLGSQLTQVAVPFQVYVITRSPLATGLVGLAMLGPVLTFALLGGALADRYDRRALLLLSDVVLGLSSALLAINAFLPRPSLAAVYLLVAIAGGAGAVQRTAFRSSIARLVDPELLASANATEGVYYNVASIGGPALAGALLATLGVPSVYAIDAASFGFSALVVLTMAPIRPLGEASAVSLRAIGEGFRFVWHSPVVLASQVLDLNAMFLGLPTALFPAIGLTRFGGPAAVGLLYGAASAGSLAIVLLSGPIGRVRRQGRGLLLAVVAWGLAITGFGLAPALLPALLFLALAGAADMVSGIYRSALVQTVTPDRLRGRMSGVEMCFYTTGPLLGEVESGFVASIVGLTGSVVLGGVGCVLGAVLVAARWRELLAYRS